MEKILVGKITGAFGVKGELKVLSVFEMPEKVFIKNNSIYIGNNKHLITSVRFHKNKYLIEIDNIKDINDVNKFRGLDVYIERKDLNLEESYLLNDLINLDVYSDDDYIGKVTSVDENPLNPLLMINNSFYVPINSNYLKDIDILNNKIIGTNLKDLDL